VELVFKLDYADPYEIIAILEKFSSKDKASFLETFETSNTKGIIAKDFQPNISSMHRAVIALDVPTASDEEALSFDFRVDVIWASNGEAPLGNQVPQSLADVVSTISSTLNYKHFAHGGTYTQKVSTNGRPLESNGVIISPSKDMVGASYFSWELKDPKKNFFADGLLGSFSARFAPRAGNGVRISDAKINLRSGHKSVIGTTMVDQSIAMIVVVSIMDAK
jgi:hypothetical protein